jgi:hypothetical protein
MAYYRQKILNHDKFKRLWFAGAGMLVSKSLESETMEISKRVSALSQVMQSVAFGYSLQNAK